MGKRRRGKKQPLPFSKSGEAKQAEMQSVGMCIERKKNVSFCKDGLNGTPLQRTVCSSEACSPYLGQRLATRRQVPLSARTFPCTGHTLPSQNKGVALTLSPVSSTPNNAPLSGSSIFRLSCAPSLPGAAATNKRRTRSLGTQEKIECLERDRQELGLAVSWWRGRRLSALPSLSQRSRSLALPVAPPEWDWTGEVSADRLWKRSRLQCWDTWWEQRGAGLPESSASAVESRLSAGASLSGGLH